MAHQITMKISEGDRSVFLATPSYDGKTSQCYTVSLASSLLLLAQHGIGVTYSSLAGDCHVDDARNALVREFMISGCDSLIFLDADVGWRADDLLALALHDRDVVAGVYPKKWRDEEEFPVYLEPGTRLQAGEDGLVEVVGVPTGFMKISRRALDIMHETYGQRKYKGQGQKEDEMPYTILFERLYEDGNRWSGDYAFCKRWRETGGKIYVDPEMAFAHEGTKEWHGCLGEFWKQKHGITSAENKKKVDAAIQALRDGTANLENMKDLFLDWGNHFAAAPDLALTCMLLAREATGPILECGSGLTTLVMALSTNQQIHVLEHSPVWAQFIENKLNFYGIENVTIHCAPMKDYGRYEWYTYPEDLPDFSFVLCDGPPRCVNDIPLKGGRYGIVELKEKVKNAQFAFDDAENGHGDIIRSIAHEMGLELTVIKGLREYALSLPKAVV